MLANGGSVSFSGRAYNKASAAENAFDGDTSSQFVYDAVRQAANRNVAVDRIWDAAVEIERIEFKTTGGGRAYEYQFLYWDLKTEQWIEIVHVKENTNQSPVHSFQTPIVTNKLRYICPKAGPGRTGNFHNIYEIFYYGNVVTSTP